MKPERPAFVEIPVAGGGTISAIVANRDGLAPVNLNGVDHVGYLLSVNAISATISIMTIEEAERMSLQLATAAATLRAKRGEPAVDMEEAEVMFWRREAAVRLHLAMTALADISADADSIALWEAQRAVRDILSTLDDAHAGRFWTLCEPCGRPMREGQWAIHYEDVGDAHADCDNPTRGANVKGAFPYKDPLAIDWQEQVIVRARALVESFPE